MLCAALSTGVRASVNLCLIPVVVKKLSTGELAQWWVFVSLGALATLADFGFGQAISRIYSYLWAGVEDFDVEGLRAPPVGAEPNQLRLRQFNSTVRRLYLWLSLGSLAVLWIGGTLFLWRSEHSAPMPGNFWLIWCLYAVAVVYSFGSSHWTLACQGIDRVRDLQLAYLWSGLLYFVVAAVLLMMGAGLWSMVVASAIRGVVVRQICHRAFIKAVPITCGEGRADLGVLKKIWPNAWKFGLLSVAFYMINSGPVLICSRVLGDVLTASFGLTSQLGTFLVTLSGLWLTVKWPQLTILRTQGKLDEMAVLFARRLALVMGTFASGALGMMLVGNRLLEWKGSNTRLISTPYLLVYLCYLGQSVFYGQFGNLTFTENVVPFYRLGIYTGVATIGCSWVLARSYGLWGLILAPLIVAQLPLAWYAIWRGFRAQPLSVPNFIRAASWCAPRPPLSKRAVAQS